MNHIPAGGLLAQPPALRYNERMREDVLDRLRKLGVTKGARDLRIPPASQRSRLPGADSSSENPDGDDPRPVEQLLPGSQVIENDYGGFLVRDRVYALSHQHGTGRLGLVRDRAADPVAAFLSDDRLRHARFKDALFLDTETTGLWGVGTFAFMVGVGFYDGDAFTVRQYFCRDHGDEAAMLLALDELAAARAFLITFNGRTFDVPLLENRYLLNRQSSRWTTAPQLDLLHPARRLWRRRLGSVALSALETNLLEVRRTMDDVPGALIPQLYHNYLRHGDGRALLGVFYHNEVDILSMVTLSEQVLGMVDDGPTVAPGDDLLSLGRWQLRVGDTAGAERTLRQAQSEVDDLALFHEVLLELALLLKRSDRLPEACPLWQQVAVTSTDGVTAHVELAKYFEWQQRDLAQALHWVNEAQRLADRRGADPALLAALVHRRDRLERKLQG